MAVAHEHVQPARWAEQFASGDKSVGDLLAEHVRCVLRRRFFALGMAPQDTEDLVQDCVTLVFDAIDQFDSTKGSLDAWLSGYARNVARSWWRGAYTRRQAEAPLDSAPDAHNEMHPGLAGNGLLEAALSDLSPIDQDLLVMRFGFGYSFDEIAAMADLTPVNARKRVSRAVECLRRNPALRTELGFTN